ncbi:MAG: hypothetical protein KGZ86_02950 [Candidatus Latescibacteria bacterium]|nr:hypothetical protein [Candidatus Latescibacterota bacterium]
MENAKKEACPKCNSENLINYVHVKTGEHIRVYVECADCHHYVARYTLLTYTSDKPYEVLLRRLKCLEYASGKKALRELEEYSKNIEAEFNHIKSLTTTELAKTVEDMIKEKYEFESCQGI